MTLIYSAKAALFTLVRVLMENDAITYHDTLTNTVCLQTADSCVHLVTLHRALPVKADHMRQAFTAAAAAPHGGHVMVKEWTVICSYIEKNTINKVCTQVLYFFWELFTVKFSPTNSEVLSDLPPPAAYETAV